MSIANKLLSEGIIVGRNEWSREGLAVDMYRKGLQSLAMSEKVHKLKEDWLKKAPSEVDREDVSSEDEVSECSDSEGNDEAGAVDDGGEVPDATAG